MPYSKVRIHLVWSTKNRTPHLTGDIRKMVFEHIKQNAIAKKINVHAVNGYEEHVHVLLTLHPDQPLAKVVQLLKGESSFWINKSSLTTSNFEWQDEYFAVSVSESSFNAVLQYIHNQENHHTKKTFQQEYNEFMIKFDFTVES